MTFAWIVLASACGAVARYALDATATRWTGSRLPYGTLVVNVLGSFGAGLVAGAVGTQGPPSGVATVVAVGFLGSFTTFSTWMHRSVLLIEEGRWAEASGSVVGGFVAGVAAAGLGLVVATAWTA
ncbi:MAG: CrcB family protein [Trueperaceae bacterium]